MSGGRPKTAWLSLGMNLAYGLYAGVLGAFDRSWWFFTLAAYYIVLAVMRFAALLSIKKEDRKTERFLSRFIGGMCLFLAVTLAGTAYLSISAEHGRVYHEIVMITFALYAFTKITLAIIHLCRTGADARPAVKCLRNLSLADAAVHPFLPGGCMTLPESTDEDRASIAAIQFLGVVSLNGRLVNGFWKKPPTFVQSVHIPEVVGGKHGCFDNKRLRRADTPGA